MNADKCRLLITDHVNDASAIIGGEIIKSNKSVILLGIKIDNKLSVPSLCQEVSIKIHALARISDYMSKDKL